MLKCPGCGAIIQTTDKDKSGYIEASVLEKRKDDFLCYRCFRLKNYNELNKVNIDEDEFINNRYEVSQNALVCNIVDAFDLEGTVINDINKLFPNNRILIIANKYDLFLRSNRPTKIKKYINSYLDELGIKTDGVIVTSSVDKKGIDKLYNSLLNTCEALNIKNNEIFLFGVSNVGKSSLIKALLSLTDRSDNLVVSNSISTTLGITEIKVNEINIFDTPGIINKKQITYYLDKETLNFAIPKKFVKPKAFQLNPNQTLFIEGFGWFDYLGEEKCSIVCYFSNQLNLHRTKLDNSIEFYESHKDDLFRFPNENERSRLGNIREIVYKDISDSEITLSGLGFIGFFGKGTIVLHTFDKINSSIRKQLI